METKDANNSDQSIVEMTPLELNGIRLDPNHTILTPSYLEDILKNPPSAEAPDA